MKSQPGSESQSIQSLSAQGKAPRRSSRIRKYRDEREFTVSSMQTLLSLKIEVIQSTLIQQLTFPFCGQPIILNTKAFNNTLQ